MNQDKEDEKFSIFIEKKTWQSNGNFSGEQIYDSVLNKTDRKNNFIARLDHKNDLYWFYLDYELC